MGKPKNPVMVEAYEAVMRAHKPFTPSYITGRGDTMEKTYTLEQLKDETIPLPPGYMRDWRGGSEGARKREAEPDVIYMIPYEDKRRKNP